MKHRLTQHRHALRRPTNRIALASAGTLVAAVLTGVALNHPPTPVTRSAATSMAAAELSGSGGDQVAGTDVPAGAAPETTSPAAPSTPVQAAATQAAPAQPAKPPAPPAAKSLDYDYQAQTTYFYCGPAATRIALTGAGLRPSQDDLAARLNTTENGTDSAEDTTRVLNSLEKSDFYSTREIPGAATPAQMDRLQADAVHAISNGHAIVANIVGTQVDTAGVAHSYDGGHYLTVVGYQDQGRILKIADPAFVNGQSSYWMTTINFTEWMATRGYSA